MSERNKKSNVPEEIPNIHWADHVAEELIEKHPQKEKFVCASGISPSGVVHIGNFREAITVDFVVRALLDRSKTVRFLYSWDDYDAFRKVPANMPNQEMLQKHLRQPISLVPDPFGQYPSYAAHFEKRFEAEICQLGVKPDYIYQNIPYREGKYVQGIKDALAQEKEIIEILNRSRTEPLPDNWTCLSIFCKTCSKDTTELLKRESDTIFSYHCKVCKKDNTIDMSKEGGVKLLWRVDWPMRWAQEGVDFEPGGKDHSSQGGSYDTGVEIVKQVWKREAPTYVQYDFVIAKGAGAKLSSSSGNLLTLGETLEIYEPAIIRWIFASRKPNLDFAIAFDLDVIKAYDDFDRCERFAYGVEEGDEKKVRYERRIYEFSCVDRIFPRNYSNLPAQFSFRHLCNVLQIHQGDLEKAKEFYSGIIKTTEDEARFYCRAKRAWKWITEFAPEEFKFALQLQPSHRPQFVAPLKELIQLLKEDGVEKWTEETLATRTFEIMKRNQVEPKAFFQDVYRILVNKPNGPKLASFLLAIGPKRSSEILEKALPTNNG
jgi:lysyl-tRNA synthetase class 1